MKRKRYRPEVKGGEQRFRANVVKVARYDGIEVVAFGDLVPPKRGPVDRGTPVHSLIFQLSGEPGESTVELNDQGNQRGTADVKRVEIGDAHLRVVFRARRGPWSGRVSLSEEIEILEDERFRPVRLTAVRVELDEPAAKLTKIAKRLAWAGFPVPQ